MCVTGTMASEKGHQWIKDLLGYYENKKFILPDGSINKIPNTQIITEITINKYGWKPKDEYQVLEEGLSIYPYEVFCAKDWQTGKINITKNTHTIHHFSASWHTKTDKLKTRVKNIIGSKGTQFIVNIKKKLKGL